MADEQVQEAQAKPEPQGEEKPSTDWKAEARKWENLAKKGKAAEEELAKLKEAQMTEQEKANARAEKAEQELAAIKAEQERLTAAREWSVKEAVPLDLLEFIAADRMESFCKAYKAAQVPIPSAASAFSTRIVKEGAKPSTRDVFAQFAEQQLNR